MREESRRKGSSRPTPVKSSPKVSKSERANSSKAVKASPPAPNRRERAAKAGTLRPDSPTSRPEQISKAPSGRSPRHARQKPKRALDLKATGSPANKALPAAAIHDEYRCGETATLRKGDLFRASRGPYYVLANGKQEPMAETGLFKFLAYLPGDRCLLAVPANSRESPLCRALRGAEEGLDENPGHGRAAVRNSAGARRRATGR